MEMLVGGADGGGLIGEMRGTIFRAKASFYWLTATIEQSSPICPVGRYAAQSSS